MTVTVNGSLSSLASEIVPLTPGIESVKDASAQCLVWRGIAEAAKNQNIIDEWSSHQWEKALTQNTLFRSLCPGEAPFPQFFSRPAEEELAAKYLKFITGNLITAYYCLLIIIIGISWIIFQNSLRGSF